MNDILERSASNKRLLLAMNTVSILWTHNTTFTVNMARSTLSIIVLPCILALSPNIQFRAGRKSDELPIAVTLGKELMNPLGISSDRFLIAQDEQSNQMIGFVQIKPLGSAKRDPAKYNARPGSYDAERDVDESIWEEFEKDETPFPIGWASFP